MGFGFWKKKGEGSEDEKRRTKPAREVKSPQDSDFQVRLRRIAIGAAVLLSALVIAGPFFVSHRAVEAESPAKTEIPPAPSPAASVPSEASAVVKAPETSVPAAPSGAQPMADSDQGASRQAQAPAAQPAQAQPDMKDSKIASAEDAARAKAKADAEAKARAAEIAKQNERAKAALDKKAKEAKKQSEDQLAAAIQRESGRKGAAADAKASKDQKAAGGVWTMPLGAFSDPAAAKKVAATARANGVPVAVSTAKSGGKALTRVTAGPFKTRDQAAAAEGRLAMAGIRAGAPRQSK
ncbi:SPOR domain-containing protein [Mesosutterella sp. OilRF-GAM-744-9]|uniref:SPOR domain-containing protein n=1 Tax=Mesosutterella porci TaxID=2915351 RepID=A0ABS9MP49_9BURK|nr:SPOR domain-containing protein [Mesosutterella sp. oilRF-744-WT-GAM-9]MCG5030393.1 SPOR domain-containing protein [Mesosutterella sp. oilRF-744-WT-GAM-9]